jgi:hypothetical protein
MPTSDDADSRLRPRPMSRPRGTNKPHGSRPSGTNKPHGSRPGGTNKPHGSQPGGTNKPHSSVPGEPEAFTSGVEDDRLTTNWIQYTERLKPGYSRDRYNAWLAAWRSRHARAGELWKNVGPDNIGGRITCMAALPGSKTLLAGAACGGLWLRDSGRKWSSIDNKWPPKKDRVQAEIVRRMHNIGALAVDPNDSEVVYCGTGHAYNAGDSFPGVGLFRSTDGGNKWELVASADMADSGPAATADKPEIPHRISAIAVDPRPLESNADYRTRIRIGGVEVSIGAEEDGGQPSGGIRPGMYYWGVSDGPVGWHRDDFKLDPNFAAKVGASDKQREQGLFVERDYQCHSIIHCTYGEDGKQTAAIMTAISGVLDWSGIWRSRDGGHTWDHLTRSLPAGREFGRTSLAVSKLDRRIVYAFIGSADGQCLGVFRTSDGGKHWNSPAGPGHFAACGRLNYTNCIAVHPKNPDLVVCGADDLHRSTDGGHTWTQVTEWFAAPNSPGYAHKDHHALLWVEKTPEAGTGNDEDNSIQYRLYSGNDGGVSSSDDNGVTWQSESRGLANLMFYDIDVTCSDAEAPAGTTSSTSSTSVIIAGGTQDNASVMTEIEASGVGYIPTELGVQLTEVHTIGMKPGNPVVKIEAPSGGNPPAVRLKDPDKNRFADMLYGDGGWIIFDLKTPLHLYGSSQFMTIYRHRIDDGWVTVTPPDATDDERGNTWMAYIAMRPDNSNIVFTGSTRLWRTQNDGEDWKPVTDHLDGGAISAIEISDAKPSVMYIGTEKGNIFKSDDAGNRWSQQDGDPGPAPLEWRRDLELPAAAKSSITRIEADPNNAAIVVATLLGFDPLVVASTDQTTAQAADDCKAFRYPHVIWFNPKDKKWRNADPKGKLPNVHHNVVTWSGDPKSDKPHKTDVLPRCVFVGNDVGVWVGEPPDLKKPDDGWKWSDISGNLPNVIVTDVVYHRKTCSLIAATYGRSIWQLGLEELKKVIGATT